MHHRLASAVFVACFMMVGSPDVMKGQSNDSLLYLIDNDLIEDEQQKYDLLCRVIQDMDDAERRIHYSNRAIELAEKLDMMPALPYLAKGEAYLDAGKFALALECFIRVADYYEKNDAGSKLGHAYVLMAETYNLQGNHENEKRYLQNAIEIFEHVKDSLSLAYALHNLGYSNYSNGQYDSALIVFTKTLDLFEKLDNPYGTYSYFVCLGNLGLVHSRLSDFETAEEYLLTAIDSLALYGDERAVPDFIPLVRKTRSLQGRDISTKLLIPDIFFQYIQRSTTAGGYEITRRP